MNTNDLTISQAKEWATLFSGFSSNVPAHPFVGKYVIARCSAAGVHTGDVVSVDGENVILKNSRRLLGWKAKDGLALSGVAQNGLKDGCKLDVINPEIYLTGVCELIPCASFVKDSVNVY